jgi:hypothetical protein
MAYSFFEYITNPCIGDSILIVKRLKISNPTASSLKLPNQFFLFLPMVLSIKTLENQHPLCDSHLAYFGTNKDLHKLEIPGTPVL